MNNSLRDTLNVDTFEMRVADIADVEMLQLQALSLSVGWPHRGPDWQHLLGLGRGFVALDEIGRVTASTMWFPHGADFATLGMLMTSPRLQENGAARWLVKHMLSECQRPRIRLNSTREAKRLYGSFGFQARRTVFQCQGEAILPYESAEPSKGYSVKRLDNADLDGIIAFDAPAFGTARTAHLVRLFEDSIGYGLYRGDELRAYAMRRRFGRGHVIGPVVATSDVDAIAVTHPHVRAHVGSFLRIDTRSDVGAFADFVLRSGMTVYDTLTTMVNADAADYGDGQGGKPLIYALASQSFG